MRIIGISQRRRRRRGLVSPAVLRLMAGSAVAAAAFAGWLLLSPSPSVRDAGARDAIYSTRTHMRF